MTIYWDTFTNKQLDLHRPYIDNIRFMKDGVKYMFNQAIFRKSDNKLCSTAKVTTVVSVNGKLTADFEPFDQLCEESKG